MKTFHELLIELGACNEAVEWAGDMTIEKIVEQCPRVYWLLWLAQKININQQKLTLAKAHCANTVRHLMKDERSIKAVDTAIAYGEGKCDAKKLKLASNAAYAAHSAAFADAAAYPALSAAAAAAARAVDPDAYAALSAAYADSAAAAAYAYPAKKQNKKETADICRKYIGQDIIDKVNELLQ